MRDYLANLHRVLPAMMETVWIGSVNRDETPHLSTRVVIGSEEGRLYFSSPAGSALTANLHRHNKGSVCAANAAVHQGVQLKGSFALHTDGPLFDRLAAMAQQMGLPPAETILEFRPFLEYSVAPSPLSRAPMA